MSNFESIFEKYVNFEGIFDVFVISKKLSMVDEDTISSVHNKLGTWLKKPDSIESKRDSYEM